MAWDAGAIEASLTIKTAQAAADLDKIEARVKRLTDTPHRIRISAVFDDASTGRALAAFRSLDTAISRDAMQRLRSSPQGSVLGALNALFSPHPVSGAPSPQQAASQGLLGKMFTPQGGGNASPAATALRNAAAAAGPGNTSSQNMIRQVLTGAAPGNVTTQDLIRQVLTGKTPGNTDTTDTVHEKLDKADAAKLVADSGATGDRAGKSFASSFGAHVTSLLSGIGKMLGGGGSAGGGGSSGGRGIGGAAGGILGGIGPGILGLGVKSAGIAGLGGAALGAAPALIGGLSPLLAAAPGLAGLGILAKSAASQLSPVLQAQSAAQSAVTSATTPAQAKAAQQQLQSVNQQVAALSPALQSMFKSVNAIKTSWKALTESFAPLMAKGLSQVAVLFQQLLPDLKQFFAASTTLMQPLIGGLGDIAKQILPEFSAAIRAAAPLIRPLLDGLGSLVSGIFPGLITLVKAAAPAVTVLSQVFGMLGKDLGAFFANLAPVLGPSGVLLKAVFGVIGALLPIIAKLAGILATALAPVFVQFAGVIQTLLPFLTTIGKIFASLAGAILGDLVSAFGALATLITGIAPGLNAFATAISSVFTVLENSGVFAILGNAIEQLAKPLGGLISAFLTGLVPILPPVIKFIGQLAALFATSLSSAVATLIPPLTTLVTSVFQALNATLPVVLPLLLQLAGIFTTAVVAAIGGVATALADIINAIPPGVLGAIVLGILGIVGAMKAMSIVNTATGFLTNFRAGLSNAAAASSDATGRFGALGGKVGSLKSAFQDLKAGFSNAAAAASESTGIWGTVGGKIAGIGSAIASAASAVASFVAQLAVTAAKAIASAAAQAAAWVASAAATVASFLAEAAAATVAFIAENLATLGIIAGITLLVAAIVYLATHWSQVWGDIKHWAEDAWNFIFNGIGKFLLPLLGPAGLIALGVIELYQHWQVIWGAIRTTAEAFWSWLSGVFGTDLANFFTKTIPGWFDIVAAAVMTHFVAPAENGFKAAWAWLSGVFGTDISNFFTKTIPGVFDAFIGFVGTRFVTPFENALKGAYNWVVTNVFNPLDTFLTKTVPGWFSTAVTDIGSFWDKVEQTVLTPVKFVVNSVLNPIGQTFDAITHALGLGRPIPKLAMASGGRIPGFGGGDTVAALLEPGETVIDKDKSKAYAWLFKMMGVPGYAAGGIPNPIPAIGHFLSGLGPGVIAGLKAALPGLGAVTDAATIVPAALKALNKILGGGVGGAAGEVGTILATMGKDTVKDVITWLTGKVAGLGSGGPGGAAPGVTGTVISWITAALKATGSPMSWLAPLEILVSKESGGNPNAINPQQVFGENASGLFQTLPSTYAQFATVPGGVFNPISDAVAGIRYLTATYGSPFNIPGLLGGNYVGYGTGGEIPEPVIGWGMSSGKVYSFGERGKEYVVPSSGAGGGTSLDDVCSRLDQLIRVAGQIPAGVGSHVGGALGGAAQAASFRNRYPRGGS